MKEGDIVDGLELGMVDERDHGGLPWLPKATSPRSTPPKARATPNTAMRDFLFECGYDAPFSDAGLAESGDVGDEATLVAFRRRHRIGPEVTLTPALIARLVADRERVVDPFA